MLKPTPNITDREQGKNCPIAIRNSKISLKQRRLWSWSVLSSCFFNSVTFSTDAEMQPLTEGTARNCQTPDYYKINGSTVLLPQQLLQQTLYSITLSPLALGPLKVNMPSFLPVHTHKAWRLWLNVFFFLVWKQLTQSCPRNTSMHLSCANSNERLCLYCTPLFPHLHPSNVWDFTSCLFQIEHKSTPVLPLELIHVQKIVQSSTWVISGLIHIIDSFFFSKNWHWLNEFDFEWIKMNGP